MMLFFDIIRVLFIDFFILIITFTITVNVSLKKFWFDLFFMERHFFIKTGLLKLGLLNLIYKCTKYVYKSLKLFFCIHLSFITIYFLLFIFNNLLIDADIHSTIFHIVIFVCIRIDSSVTNKMFRTNPNCKKDNNNIIFTQIW